MFVFIASMNVEVFDILARNGCALLAFESDEVGVDWLQSSLDLHRACDPEAFGMVQPYLLLASGQTNFGDDVSVLDKNGDEWRVQLMDELVSVLHFVVLVVEQSELDLSILIRHGVVVDNDLITVG